MREPAQSPVVDLTLTLDPAEFYGEDMGGCPDWPVTTGFNPGPDISRPDDAEKHLARLSAALNPSGAQLREPSRAERTSLRSRYFTDERPVGFEDPDEAAWRNRHGMHDLRPRDRAQLTTLNRIIEAAHIRGYLHKAAARKQANEARQSEAHTAEAKRKLEASAVAHADLIAEYEGLAEAAARHDQRLEDERAWRRRIEIKRHALPGQAAQVRDAANTLGVAPPELQAVE